MTRTAKCARQEGILFLTKFLGQTAMGISDKHIYFCKNTYTVEKVTFTAFTKINAFEETSPLLHKYLDNLFVCLFACGLTPILTSY